MRKAEAAQLIILNEVFSHPESRNLIFQGGTAIRWLYGGLRFSEDLDFVTTLSLGNACDLLKAVSLPIKRQWMVHFGPGSLILKEKPPASAAYHAFFQYTSPSGRTITSVKTEFERLKADSPGPDYERYILQSVPPVAACVAEGLLRLPPLTALVQVETAEEILSDKLRALLERPYIKGRDFFDLWFLTDSLKVTPDASSLQRKLEMYEAPFRLATPVSTYLSLEYMEKDSFVRELDRDLSRFLPPELLTFLQGKKYQPLVRAVYLAFRQIEEAAAIDFEMYPKRRNLEHAQESSPHR